MIGCGSVSGQICETWILNYSAKDLTIIVGSVSAVCDGLVFTDRKYCDGCFNVYSDDKSFFCKRGYWSARSPHTLSFENRKIIRPRECTREAK